ncbi:polyprenyl synthetase family protein [Acaryochloris marina]|uniref:Uncharacterized protein n=1 Tax=Acaryochloris marina (strain MBIC 11017) TaxID=329726 RepID=B0C2R6_ACAM1|nr:polyprenyl synthetase family protein [Acaryochloris marina]ABW30954.1 hypothetical protein AM1_6022 [Acaryochloris marina MBIC11017]BDM79685.1 hypothetical protein AM10699_25530 [Acaryochloris marina MBIC10699]
MIPGDILKAIRLSVITLASDADIALGELMSTTLPDPLPPVAILPVATGLACGGSIEQLIPVTSTIVAVAFALRTLDDIADQDNSNALHQKIGIGRAANFSAALIALASREIGVLSKSSPDSILMTGDYFDALLRIFVGQDKDIQREVRSLVAYEEVVELKTVAAYELAAIVGANAVTADGNFTKKCRVCGRHIGWAQQILDDIEAFWFLDNAEESGHEQYTYPVLLGIENGGSTGEAVSRLCNQKDRNDDAIRNLLDSLDVRGQLMMRALDHRDQALLVLGPPLRSEGHQLIKLWFDWLFRDGERLLKLSSSRSLISGSPLS